jgi:hypothetical protein
MVAISWSFLAKDSRYDLRTYRDHRIHAIEWGQNFIRIRQVCEGSNIPLLKPFGQALSNRVL